MGRVEGKVAVVTGAARGQGRSHAVRLAEEGADIIAIDACRDDPQVPYPLGTEEDLRQTVAEIEGLGRRVAAAQADIRDYGALKQAIDSGAEELGGLDIVCANAGICNFDPLDEMSSETWQTAIDINLTGSWHTAKASIPHLRAAKAGSIIFISSIAGLTGLQGIGGYVASKHGVVGMMRTLALELAPEMIRANTINPTNVETKMMLNDYTWARFAPDLSEEERTLEAMIPRFQSLNSMPIPWVQPVDVSNAVVWLASDEARYVTGIALPIDAGAMAG